MNNVVKVFHNDQVIKFLHKESHHCSGCVYIQGQIKRDDILGFIESGQPCLCLVDDKPEQNFSLFCSFFDQMFAAGGMVMDEEGRVLLINRHGKWDLPKGIIDKGESPVAAAIREVVEECGIPAPTMLGFLKDTYHMYTLKNGQWVIKKTTWYAMLGRADSQVSPQLSEGITEVVWAGEKFLQNMLKESYGNIAELIRETNRTTWIKMP